MEADVAKTIEPDTSTEKIEERNHRIRTIFENAQLETQLAALDRASSTPGNVLAESYFGDAPGPIVDRYEFLSDNPDFLNASSPYALISDREEGGLRPFFSTETELFWILGRARLIALTSPFSFGALNTLTNYVFGESWQYEIKPSDGFDVDDKVVSAMNRILNRILDASDWPGHREREAHQRAHRDGECFVQIKTTGEKGVPVMRFVEPEQVVQPLEERELESWVHSKNWGPGDASRQSWKFGIHTDFADTEEVYGYHVIWSATDTDWDYIPEGRMTHIKRNVDFKVKRGISDFYTVRGDLEREAKLRRNMAEGAALQAAIAWVFEPPPLTTQSGVASMITGGATHKQQVDYPNRSKTLYGRKYEPGTILTPPNGSQYKPGPSANGREAGFEVIQQSIHRAIGKLWDMPEFMISMDASNANYASSLVAESPFVKAREHDQAFYKRHYRNLLWKAMKVAYRRGLVKVGMPWKKIERTLEIQIDAPPVDSRDKTVEATTNQIYMQTGVKSRRTVAHELNLDYDEELDRMKSEPQIGVQDGPMPQSMNFGSGEQTGFSPETADAAANQGPDAANMDRDEQDVGQGKAGRDDAAKKIAMAKAAVAGGQPQQAKQKTVEEAENPDTGSVSVEDPPGEFATANRRTFGAKYRTAKDVIKDLRDDDITPGFAVEMLKSIGIAGKRAMRIIDDAVSGDIIDDAMIAEALAEAGPNCGTGAGGFKPGNKCASGAVRSKSPKASKTKPTSDGVDPITARGAGGDGDPDEDSGNSPAAKIPTNKNNREVVTEMDLEAADIIASQGLRPDFKPQIGEVETFQPGRGIERNATYVVDDGAISKGSFGSVRVHIDAPPGAISLPREQTQLGVTNVNTALKNENGAVIARELSPEHVKSLELYRHKDATWSSLSREDYLRLRKIDHIGRLPSVDQYRKEVEKRADELFLSSEKIEDAVRNYNRADLRSKWEEVESFREEFGVFTESYISDELDEFLEAAGTDCGTGAGGFKPDNNCAAGKGGGSGSSKSKKSSDDVTKSQGTVRHGKIDIDESRELDRLLDEKGGFTYNPVDNMHPKSGFAVSPFPEAEKVFDADVTPKDIIGYLKQHAERFTDPRVNVGGWYDTESGKTYLDLSIVAETQAQGVSIARKHNQEGIYDLASGKTIITKKESARRK